MQNNRQPNSGRSGYKYLGFRNRGGFKRYSPDGPLSRHVGYGRGGRGASLHGEAGPSGFRANYHRGSDRGRAWVHGGGDVPGPILDWETELYFEKVNARFKSEFENEEDKDLFLASVGDQTINKELKLSRNRSASFCIQMLLSQTKDPGVLTRFMTVFSDDLRMVCTHLTVSHVVQTLLQAGFKYLQCPSSYTAYEEEDTKHIEGEEYATCDEVTNDVSEDAEDGDENEGKAAMVALTTDREKVIFWTLRVGRFCLDNLKELMSSPLACHVTRTVMQVLGGCMVEDKVMRNKKARQCDPGAVGVDACEATYVVPKEFADLLTEYVAVLTEDTVLGSILCSSMASPLLQTLLAIYDVQDKDVLASLVVRMGDFVFSKSGSERGFPAALANTSASYVVERLIKYGTPEYISKVWRDHLQGHFLNVAVHPVANFCAQRLLESVGTVDEFHDMYEELASGFDSLMCRNITVLVCIAEACKRFSTYEDKFILKLQETLNCANPEDRHSLLVPLTLYMTTYGDYECAGPHAAIVHQGALIIQHALHFQKPTKVVNSLLAMAAKELAGLACCPKGSHVIDAFIMSPSVTVQQRTQLLQKMKGFFYIIATDKYGSLVIDNFWKVATITQKVKIAEELSQKEHLLTASVYGGFVVKKCALYHFKHRRNEWMQAETAKQKTAELFQDILE